MAGEGTNNTATDQTATDQAFQNALIQATAGTQTGAGLGQDFPYPVRKIKGIKPELQSLALADTKRTSFYAPQTYGGHLLVDENNIVARTPYDPYKERRIELTALNQTDRTELLNLLASRGFYGNSKPSRTAYTGERFEEKDLQAMEDLLYYANSRGATWKPLYAELKTMPQVAPVGGGTNVRVTSPEDLGVYLREESFRQLGRNLTKQELQAAILGIQNQQRQRAGSKQDAPSIATAAQMQVGQIDPDRASAMKLGRALQLMFSGQ